MNESPAGGDTAAGTLAEEIARARADAPAIGHAADEPCANCGAVRHGPYCHRCGQAGHVHRHAGALVHDIAHGVFHFEGRIWRTLPLLALRPGELTRRYIAGERAKFVSPMALFLFSVFLMFAILSNIPGAGVRFDIPAGAGTTAQSITLDERLAAMESARAALPEGSRRVTLDASIGRIRAEKQAAQRGARPESGPSGTTRLPNDLDLRLGWPWFDKAFRHAAANPDLLSYKMKTYAYKYSWALIPISLPFIWLLFAFRRDKGFYDHAIFAIYSLAFMSLGAVALGLLGAIGLPNPLIMLAIIVVPPVHMYRQLKGAYGLTHFGAGWRTAALITMTLVTMLLFLAFLFYLGVE